MQKNGEIYISLEENTKTDTAVSSVIQTGKFEIIDTNTSEVLMNNTDIELSNVMYYQDSSTGEISVYLNIEFNDEGSEKFKNISNTYIEYEIVELSEEGEEETVTYEDTITLYIDDSEIMSTSFSETVDSGSLQLTVGSATTDEDEIESLADSALDIAVVLDTGNYPIDYDLDANQYVYSEIDGNMVITLVATILSIIGLIILTVKNKKKGLIAGIFSIGYIALLLLVVRYTNVIVSITGIAAIILVSILNIMFNLKMLELIDEKQYFKETFKEKILDFVPAFILTIAFCFISWTPISTFGMMMFWGLLMIFVYNFCVTSKVFKLMYKK